MRSWQEFDESQHFTLTLKLTLGFYPADLHFGFDRTMWGSAAMSFKGGTHSLRRTKATLIYPAHR
jgi:hypothetical protein